MSMIDDKVIDDRLAILVLSQEVQYGLPREVVGKHVLEYVRTYGVDEWLEGFKRRSEEYMSLMNKQMVAR